MKRVSRLSTNTETVSICFVVDDVASALLELDDEEEEEEVDISSSPIACDASVFAAVAACVRSAVAYDVNNFMITSKSTAGPVKPTAEGKEAKKKISPRPGNK